MPDFGKLLAYSGYVAHDSGAWLRAGQLQFGFQASPDRGEDEAETEPRLACRRVAWCSFVRLHQAFGITGPWGPYLKVALMQPGRRGFNV